MSQSYSWTQPLCTECWPEFINGDREPVTVLDAPTEQCCHCGVFTGAGIYVRVDPDGHFCRFPQVES